MAAKNAETCAESQTVMLPLAILDAARDGHLTNRAQPMPKGSMFVRDGVRIIQGTPLAPLTRPTLFIRVLRVTSPDKPPKTRASLWMARPGGNDYVVKELIPDMELGPEDALAKAVAIAKCGEIGELYLNADLESIPTLSISAVG